MQAQRTISVFDKVVVFLFAIGGSVKGSTYMAEDAKSRHEPRGIQMMAGSAGIISGGILGGFAGVFTLLWSPLISTITVGSLFIASQVTIPPKQEQTPLDRVIKIHAQPQGAPAEPASNIERIPPAVPAARGGCAAYIPAVRVVADCPCAVCTKPHPPAPV